MAKRTVVLTGGRGTSGSGDGTPGRPGPPGKSAYEVAVDNGFVGTEAEWLESLIGDDGMPGMAVRPIKYLDEDYTPVLMDLGKFLIGASNDPITLTLPNTYDQDGGSELRTGSTFIIANRFQDPLTVTVEDLTLGDLIIQDGTYNNHQDAIALESGAWVYAILSNRDWNIYEGTGSSGGISEDFNNAAIPGTDGLIWVDAAIGVYNDGQPPEGQGVTNGIDFIGDGVDVTKNGNLAHVTIPGGVDPADLISTDVGNLLGLGSDGKLFVGELPTQPPPVIDSITPDVGPEAGGTAVTITGTGFAMPTTVKFGDTAAENVTVVSDTEITADTPPGTGAVTVAVTTDGGTATFDSFTYAAEVTLTSIDPDTGPVAGGTVVTITGTGFTSVTAVFFHDGVGEAFSVDSDTQITVTTPPATVEGPVVVALEVAAGNVEEPDGFTYVVAPTIDSIDPDTGPEDGGTEVTITGTNFQS